MSTEAPTGVPGPGAGFWRQQIDLAAKVRKMHEGWWDANLKAYAPPADTSPEKYASEVNTNRDFTLVERKKADLFYQAPEATLRPTPLTELPLPVLDPMTGQPALDPATGQPQTTSALPALTAHQQIVNELVGPDEIDVLHSAVHPAIFDVLCTAGRGATVLGYEATMVPSEVVDPLTGEATPVEVPVHERFFWEHIDPKQVLTPHDATHVRFDRLPWLGYRFQLPLTAAARRKYQLPDDFEGSPLDPDQTMGGRERAEGSKVFTGTELWYRSALYRDDIAHPEHLTHLVLIDGRPTPAIHQDCPYQTLDDRGQLTPDSLRGFPLHILTTRVLTGSAYPPSDCTMIRPLANELNIFRKQMVDYRDAMVMRFLYNTDLLPPDALDKALKASVGGAVGVPGDAFGGEGPFKEIPHGSMPRESFTSNDYIDNDIARTTAIDASGAGVQSSGSTTATEQQIIAANANARLDFERAQVLDWYVKGLNKISTLIQRELSLERAAEIVGVQAAQVWDQWRRSVRGSLAFTAMPDSALRVDQAVDRRQAQEFYTYVANDPFLRDRQKLLEALFRKFHIDPSGMVGAPPAPTPAQPSTSFAFNGEDVVAPQAPIVVELLQQLGFKISPEAVQQSQGMLLQAQQLEAAAAAEADMAKGQPNTAHGGKVAPMESLSKHAADATGAIQGIGGAPGALGATGGRLQ